MVRGLKFRIKDLEGLYYLFRENKGADQLRGYREADLRLCFCICKKPVFLRRGSDYCHVDFYFRWYFGKVSRNASEEWLLATGYPKGSFLIRQGEASPGKTIYYIKYMYGAVR